MKIKQILEARYTGDINKISVHQVFQLYKEHNTEVGIGADPLIRAKQTYGGGTPEEANIISLLTFRSSEQSQTDLMRWVREYTKVNRLPYTEINNRGTQAIQIRYSIPPSKWLLRKIDEVSYTSGKPLTTEDLSKIYRRYDNTREAWQRLGLKERGTLWITMSEPGTPHPGLGPASTPVLHFETRGLSEHSAQKIVKRFLVKNNIPYNYVHSTITHVSPAGAAYVIVVVTYDPELV